MSETVKDIITEALGVFEELRKHGYNVVSVDRMADIIDRIEAAWKREVDELRRRLKVAEDAISSASDAFRFCIEQCELEISPKMIGKLCDDGQACERALSFIREEGGSK